MEASPRIWKVFFVSPTKRGERAVLKFAKRTERTRHEKDARIEDS